MLYKDFFAGKRKDEEQAPDIHSHNKYVDEIMVNTGSGETLFWKTFSKNTIRIKKRLFSEELMVYDENEDDNFERERKIKNELDQ